MRPRDILLGRHRCAVAIAAASALAFATACLGTPGPCYMAAEDAGDSLCGTNETTEDGTTSTTSAGPEATTSTTSESGPSTGPEPVCGDGVVDQGEACDDGNDDSTDVCTNMCQLATCGDGFILADAEECDDGNLVAGDGCNDTCELEICGNGVVDAGEDCDDGNEDSTDECTNNCAYAACGDGFMHADVEVCDDGNNEGGDGCESDCTVTPGARSIDAGDKHTCAILWTGGLRCWGDGEYGKLGYASEADVGGVGPLPYQEGDVLVSDPLEPVQQVAAGTDHSCALLESGAAHCWGSDANGKLGLGTEPEMGNEAVGDDEHPSLYGPLMFPADKAAIAIDATIHHTCAVLEGGEVSCWGLGTYGALGYNNTTSVGNENTLVDTGVVDLGEDVTGVTNLALGFQSTCVLTEAGHVRCWGRGEEGRLGTGSPDDVGDGVGTAVKDLNDLEFPPGLMPSEFPLANKYVTACALFAHGGARCWGRADDGQLGTGETVNDIGDEENEINMVADINLGAGVEIRQIVVGNRHTCALADKQDQFGLVYCWGTDGGKGVLGAPDKAGATVSDSTESQEVKLGGQALALAAGGEHTCAIMSYEQDYQVRCWGNGADGRLGNGSIENIGDDEDPDGAENYVRLEAP